MVEVVGVVFVGEEDVVDWGEGGEGERGGVVFDEGDVVGGDGVGGGLGVEDGVGEEGGGAEGEEEGGGCDVG